MRYKRKHKKHCRHESVKVEVILTDSKRVQELEQEVKGLKAALHRKDVELMSALQYAPRMMEVHDMLLQAKWQMKMAGLDVSWIGKL